MNKPPQRTGTDRFTVGPPAGIQAQKILQDLTDEASTLKEKLVEFAQRFSALTAAGSLEPVAPVAEYPRVTEVTQPKRRGRPPKKPVPAVGQTILQAVPDIMPPTKILDIRERIAAALTRESLDSAQLAKTIGESVEKTTETLRVLRDEHRIFNVGLGEDPTWTWRVGEIEPSELRAVIRRLITERPMGARELARATGARMSKVSGHIVDIQRSGAHIINLNKGRHVARWFIIDGAKDARMPPKMRPKKQP